MKTLVNKILIIPVLILLLTIIFVDVCFAASSWTVCSDGDFTTIQSAINNNQVADNDTLFICAGTYNENVNITKDLYIIGEDSSTVIVSANNSNSPVIIINTDFVEISGLTISNSTRKEGIYHSSSSNKGSAIIRNNIITNNRQPIEMSNVNGDLIIKNNIIRDGIISQVDFGIRLTGKSRTSAKVTISNNLIDLGSLSSSYKYGVFAQYFPKVTFSNNSINLVHNSANLLYFQKLDSLYVNDNSTTSDVYRSLYTRYIYEYISVTNNNMPSSDDAFFQNNGNSNVNILLDNNDFSGAKRRAVYIHRADNVTMINNHFEAASGYPQSQYNVYIKYISDLTFTDNHLGTRNINKHVLYARDGKSAVIKNNTQYGKGYVGIYLKYLKEEVIVQNNSADSSKYGLLQSGNYSQTDYIIKENDFSDCTLYGIYVTQGDTVSINGNQAAASSGGTQSGYSIYVRKSNKVTVSDNTCGTNRSDKYAIYLREGKYSDIVNNTINPGNAGGIYLYKFTKKTNIERNSATGSTQYGCKIYNSSKSGSFTIKQNDFSGSNRFGVYVNRADSVSITNTAAQAKTGGTQSDVSIYVNDVRSYVEILNDTVGTHSIASGDYAIKVTNSKKVVIRDNIVESPNYKVIYVSGSALKYLEVIRNYATDFKYGLYNSSGSSSRKVIIKQNLFAEGIEKGVYVSGGDSLIFINNTLTECKYGIYFRDVDAKIKNNIVTDNTYGFYRSGSGGYSLSYNNVWNNTTDYKNLNAGATDISEDPKYVDAANDDYHIKSKNGSYHGGAWTPDNEDSPSLDAGDPNDDYSNEPQPNGGRINMGAYGNTSQASKASSVSQQITLEYENFPRKKWVMWGVPLTPEDPDPFKVLGDDFGNQPPSGVNWRTVRWVTTDEGYAYYGETGEGDAYALTDQDPPDFAPGLGFWIIQDVFNSVTVDVTGYPQTVGQPDTVELVKPAAVDKTGHNMIANPFNAIIDWSDTKVTDGTETKTILEAATANWLSAYAATWNYNLEEYEIVSPNESTSEDTVVIWEGFWVNQLDYTKNLKLIFPYPSTPKMRIPRPPFVDLYGKKIPSGRGKQKEIFIDWALDLQLITNDGRYRDVNNRIGVSISSLDGIDGHDFTYYAPMASEYGALYFPHDDWINPTRLDYDYRSNEWDEQVWQFDVVDFNVNDDWYLRWPNISNVPGTIKLFLMNEGMSDTLIKDLREDPGREYEITLTGSDTTFNLKAVAIIDSIPPMGTAGFAQNPVISNYIDLYVFPNEPLAPEGLDISVNDFIQTAEFSGSNYNVYRSSFSIEDGIDTITLFMEDLEGNITDTTLVMNFVNAMLADRITSPDNKIELLQISEQIKKRQEFIGVGYGLNYTEHKLPAEIVGDIYTVYLPFIKSGEDLKVQFNLSLFGFNPNEYSEVSIYQESSAGWVPVKGIIDKKSGTLTGDITQNGRVALLQISGNSTDKAPIPEKTALLPNYPNPFNAITIIPYTVRQETHVKVTIYDLLGREVAILRNEISQPGQYKITWYGKDKSGRPVASGMYLLRFEADGIWQVRKITMIK